MNLSDKTLSDAQFALDNGYASEEDARAYAETWNKHKTATQCRVAMEARRPRPSWPVLMCPTLIVEDLED